MALPDGVSVHEVTRAMRDQDTSEVTVIAHNPVCGLHKRRSCPPERGTESSPTTLADL
jgi:hypothetical protein